MKGVHSPQSTVHSWLRATAFCLLPTAYFFLPAAYFLLAYPTNAQRNKGPKPHHENLTVHRLQFPEVKDSVIQKSDERTIDILPATNSVNIKVDEVLDSIARFNKTKMFVDGFTIQIYSGLKRDEAMNIKKKMAEQARDLVADLRYEQPKWRVKTGSYFTRLEAQRDLHKLKRIFPSAILIPEKMMLKW